MKKKSAGFTIAELLIAVAVIAVLVGIAIPVFTSQLEKSMETTDLANVRSMYAEVMAAAISDDPSAAHNGQSIRRGDGVYLAVLSPITQKTEGWTMDISGISIGGVSANDSVHWIGTPVPGGSCTVMYTAADSSVSIIWSGTSEGSGGAAAAADPAQQALAATQNTRIAEKIGTEVLNMLNEANASNGAHVTVAIYKDGTCEVSIDDQKKTKLTPEQIKDGLAGVINP